MLVTIGRYLDPWEAHIVCARLRFESIPAIVSGDQHMMADWPLCVALGGAAIQVPASFAPQASDVIAAYHSGALAQDLLAEHPESIELCLSCHSAQIRASIPYGTLAFNIATTAFASAPFSTAASMFTCQSCGHQWRYGG